MYFRPQKLNKSLLLFTNDDNPVSDEKNDKNRAMASAQDMYKNFIIYDHIHLGEDYDANKFYKVQIIALK